MANIALVDDDKNILASVSMLLEQEGYHVRAYADGATAFTARVDLGAGITSSTGISSVSSSTS